MDRSIGFTKLVLTGLLRQMVRSSRTMTIRGVRHAILRRTGSTRGAAVRYDVGGVK
jgi:hypothetical protein